MTSIAQVVTNEVAERKGQVVKVTRSATYYTALERTLEMGVVLWKRSGPPTDYFAQEWSWWSDEPAVKLEDYQGFYNFDGALAAYGRMGGLL